MYIQSPVSYTHLDVYKRQEVLVPAVAKTLDIAAKAKPTKEEIITTAKITAAVTVATAVVSLAVQAVLRNR